MKKSQVTSKEKQHIIQLYQNGNSTREIAAKVKYGKTLIGKMVKDSNLSRNRFECQGKSFNNKYFDTLNREDQAYFLGLIYADGCISKSSKNSWKFGIALKKEDGYLIHLLKKCLKSKHKVCLCDNGGYPCCSLTISNKHFGESLINLGVVPRKSLVCDFPDCIPSNLMNHFIRGYFDGDGCIYFGKKKGKKKIKLFPVVKIVGSKKFIFKLGNLLRSKQMKLSIHKDGVIYGLQMSYSNVEKFMDFIYCYSSIWMKRKRKRWEGFMK